ncbi:MAG: hypothetical protein JWO94_2213 [Verrucomicrobiaceae bacterium]|nr:hypothetical protein [Verrucomicrobiaceae bacterium]
MKILTAMDKFKGSLTATQAGEAVARGLYPLPCDLCPIADGGEGTCEAIVTATGGRWQEIQVTDAIGRPVTARYGLCPNGDAVMEMSAASGLAQVADRPLTPHLASTHGTGTMIRDAIERGARRIIIGIGGSATNDGGMGMAKALGHRFLDGQGNEVIRLPEDFENVVRVERGILEIPEILVACDVDNPLLGERGATRVYGAQKGVTDMPFFEARLQRLADLIQRDLGTDYRAVPGVGAAGGLGFGLMSFCHAKLVSGFDLIAEVTGLEARMNDATLVVTGEGRVDSQTLFGKGPAGVADMARRHGLAVIAIAGAVEDSEAVRSRFDEAYAIKPLAMPLAEAMRRGAELIEETVVRHAGRFRELAAPRPA